MWMGFRTVRAYFSSGGVPVDRPVQLEAQVVIRRRWREDVDSVLDTLHTFDVLDGVLCSRFKRSADHLARESYSVSIDLAGDVIENAEPGKHHQFMANLLVQSAPEIELMADCLVPLPPGRQ